MRDYPHIAERVLNTPLLAHPDKAETVAGVVIRRHGIDLAVSQTTVVNNTPRANPLREEAMVSGSRHPFLFDPQTGIGVLEVEGNLAHRQGYIGMSSGVTGYDGIGAQLNAAEASHEVRGLIVDMHTPGGEVAGAFQLADRMAAFSKPLVAIANEMAFSAGYLLAAACDEIYLASDTAHVGSIGVVMVHFSIEQALQAEGIKPTIIQAGAQKADGNPYEDLPEEVRDRFQARIDAIHDEFVSRVATWRGLSEDAVRATEAGTFMGGDAVKAGLANGIADPADVFTALADEVNASPPALRAI